MMTTTILGFYMTSRPPCWSTDQILQEFNFIIMQKISMKNMAVDHVSENQQ